MPCSCFLLYPIFLIGLSVQCFPCEHAVFEHRKAMRRIVLGNGNGAGVHEHELTRIAAGLTDRHMRMPVQQNVAAVQGRQV